MSRSDTFAQVSFFVENGAKIGARLCFIWELSVILQLEQVNHAKVTLRVIAAHVSIVRKLALLQFRLLAKQIRKNAQEFPDKWKSGTNFPLPNFSLKVINLEITLKSSF